MCYPVCGMVHTKDLLPIRKTSYCFSQCSMTGLTKAMVCAILSVEWCIQKICCQSEILVIFQPVLHDWCNKGYGMCYPVCGMVNIKELLPIGKRSPCSGGSRFPLSLSHPLCSDTIYIYVNKMCSVHH